MLCALEVALTIMGIVAIFKQKLQLGKGKVLTGIPAILVGLLMVATIPLVFCGVVVLMVVLGAMQQPPDAVSMWEIAVHLGVLAFIGLTAFVVTAIFGHPEEIAPINPNTYPTFADALPPNPNWPPPPPPADPKNPYSPPNMR